MNELKMTDDERFAANCRKLPVTCYTLPVAGAPKFLLTRLVRGESGFYDATNQINASETPEAARDRLNDDVPGGVTVPQRQAMLNGSLFGFHTPAADPDTYNPNGTVRHDFERNDELPADALPPGPMTGLTEADIHAQDAAGEAEDAKRVLDEDVEMLPCPFCGGDPVVEREGTNRRSCIVACTDCGCRLESNEQGSGASWNHRK